MKSRKYPWIVLLLLVPGLLMAQEKMSKEQRKLEKQQQTEEMVKAVRFVFAAQTAYPEGGTSVDLSMDNYFVEYSPDLIVSDLPYYGKAYSGVAYGGGGIRFTAKPGEYTTEQTKKGYIIKTEVREASDTYTLTLTVASEGSASLAVYSNNRSNITFTGDLRQKK